MSSDFDHLIDQGNKAKGSPVFFLISYTIRPMRAHVHIRAIAARVACRSSIAEAEEPLHAGKVVFFRRTKTMLKFSISIVVAGAGMFAASTVNAANISPPVYVGPNDSLIEQVRTVCDDRGRCYRTHGGRRVIVEDSYNYAPRERYYGQRTYRQYDAPRAGIGIDAPGVSVGVGTGRW